MNVIVKDNFQASLR